MKVWTDVYVGTGAAKTISSCPFPPKTVDIYGSADYDNGTALASVALKTDNMTDDMFFNLTTAAQAVVFAGQGVTLASTGFVLGTSTVVNDSGVKYLFVARG